MAAKLASGLGRVEMSFRANLRRSIDSRPARALLLAAAAVLACGAVVGAAPQRWRAAAPLPVPRTEVAAARLGKEIAVVGGYLPWGDTSAQADAYSPATDRWRRLPELPKALNHASAASWRGRLVVVGGYPGTRPPSRDAWIFENGGWRALPPMPAGRGAAGAAVIDNTLYVVAGVGPAGLARSSYAFDLVRRRWRTIPGPMPREHLAVTAAAGRVYAIAGRTAGLDTNVRTVESYRPGSRRWIRHRQLPSSRGGTAATARGNMIVSVGGEAPTGTIASVYGYDLRTRRWRQLPSLPTPRHGLGAVTFGKRVYVIGGGPQPGLTTSGANEFLELP
jgi:N-acetylneuraminic acid mutarotase